MDFERPEAHQKSEMYDVEGAVIFQFCVHMLQKN
jgi:hypothetical protein